jgi:hypothetical protein
VPALEDFSVSVAATVDKQPSAVASALNTDRPDRSRINSL